MCNNFIYFHEFIDAPTFIWMLLLQCRATNSLLLQPFGYIIE
uniref:Uncharacterized protein n=1 Tax=Meloidogyne enterolobii TaxID=390850 RepID=A0A6V7W5X1_MELEN|nr:unnamed protein product [Meloidogyne enterolobii]